VNRPKEIHLAGYIARGRVTQWCSRHESGRAHWRLVSPDQHSPRAEEGQKRDAEQVRSAHNREVGHSAGGLRPERPAKGFALQRCRAHETATPQPLRAPLGAGQKPRDIELVPCDAPIAGTPAEARRAQSKEVKSG